MESIKQLVTIPEDHRLRMDVVVPDHVPAGEAEVIVVIAPVGTEPEPVDWDSLVGSLADSPIFSRDPVALQREMRDEWE